MEHPADSHAWRAFGLAPAYRGGGWRSADDVGHTCCVEQGNYGHRARKATWLYAVGVDLRSLRWGRSAAVASTSGDGFHTAEERAAAKLAGHVPRARLAGHEVARTPDEFRDLLLDMARSVRDVPGSESR